MKQARIVTIAIFCLLIITGAGISLFMNRAQAMVPLSGTKNIPGDYATLAAAITDLNTQGVGAGGVTFNVIAGNPQTAPAGGYVIGGAGSLVLTSTSAANPVVIQGNGNTITAATPQTAGNLNDAIFKLIGADWVTITGCTMQENAANVVTATGTNTMTEWGVALLYVTTTDGSQNNTIQNNTISLNRTYLNTFGIYSNTRHSATAVTTSAEVTAASGSNSFNKIYGNAISNVNYGIVFIGAGTTIAAIDNGNDIGGASAATGNTITNWGGGAAPTGYISLTGSNYCIFDNQQINDNVSFNTITSAALAQSVTTGGLLKNYSVANPVGTITTTINNNTVTVTNNPTAATTGSVIGLNNQGLTTLLSTATMSMNNNTVQNCVLGGATSTTNGLTAITNLSLPGTMNMTGNSVINNAITATTATTGTNLGMSNSGAAGTVNMNNNVVRSLASTATSGQVQGIVNTGAVVTAINMNNNQLGNATSGFFTTSTATSGSLFGLVNGGGASTAALTIQSNDIRGITYNVAASAAQNFIQNTATTLSQNISSNTFTNLNVNTTGNVVFIADSVSVPAAGSKTINGNSIVTAFNKGGAGGTIALYSDGGSSTSTTPVQNNNNNFSNITVTGATTITGWFNNDGTGSTPQKTMTGNTFSNWTGGTNSIIVFQSNFGGSNTMSSNTITNITGQSTVTGLLVGSSGTVATLNVSTNTVSGLSSTGAGGAVIGISSAIATTTSTTISSNTVNTLSSTGAVAVNGIVNSAGTTANVFKNKIYDISGSNASSTVNGLLLSGGTTVNAFNNLIGDLRTPAANAANPLIGLSITGGTTVNVSYNTVYLNATSSGAAFGSSAISASTTPTVVLRNNIFVNTSTPNTTGLTVAYRRSSTTLTSYGAASNNNDFYAGTPGATRLIFFDGTNSDQIIGAFKTRVTPRDSASFSENPPFLSTTGASANFLHIDPTIATQLESGGTPIGGITDDFDGQTRNASTPDVGADEFAGIPIDLTAPVITYTPFGNTTFTTNRTLTVTITDASGVPTSGGLQPRIYYRKNGGSYFSNQCSLSSGTGTNGTWSCTINYADVGGVIVGDVIDYFVVAQDTAGTPNISANPSTGFAATDVNNVTSPPTTPNTYTIVAAFPTSVNVGTGEAYTSLTNNDAQGLFKAINASILTANVTVNITSNLTGETGAIALNQFAEEGGNAGTITLTIKPSGVARSITGTGVNLIKLNGANRVTIDGSLSGGTDRSLTIENTNATTPSVVWFGSVGTTPITNDTLKNCIIRNGVNTSSAVFISDAGTIGNPGFFSTITVQNNDIQKAFVGVYANGGTTPQNGANLTYSQNTLNTSGTNAIRSVGLYMQGVNTATVSNNTIGNFNATNDENDAGIWLATGTINATVSGNAISTLNYTGTGAFSPIGINVTPAVASSNDIIRQNSVSNMTSGGSSSTNVVMGISVTGTSGAVTIERNNVQNIGNTNTETWPAVGINLNGGNNIVVQNNFVARIYNDQTAGTGGFSTTFGVSGIRLNLGTGHQVYHNSVHLYGAMTGSVSSNLLSALAISSTAVTGCDVRNNVLSNQMTGGNPSGGNTRFAAINLPSGGTSAMNLTLNNNAYFEGTDPNDRMAVVGQSVGSGDFAAANFNPGATTPSTNFRSYSSTLSAGGLNDNASLASTSAPPFISNNDLHVTGSNVLLGAGVAIGSVTTDYDNDPRPASNPDIGADEVVMATGGTLAAGTYYNVSTANGDTLGGDVTVTNQLTLNGVLNTGSFTLTMDCGASVVGAGASSYVIGNVRKNYCANGSFTYPVGTANGYSPVDATITLIINPSSLMVKAVQGPRPGLNASTSLQRYWTLTETSGDLTANLTFNYLNDPNPPNPQNTNDVMGNEANYRIIRVEGSTFTNFPNNCPSPCVDPTANTATVNGVNNFSDWTLGEPDAPTAVRLRSFAARRTENGVLLEWDSGFEVDNLGYNIYREQNGVRVRVTPSLVAGSALKTGPGTQLTAGMSYAWWDMNASASAQYWLEDVDLEGKQTMYGPFTQQAASGTARPVASMLLGELTAGAASSAAQREWPAAIDAQSPKSVSAINRAETSSLEQQFGLAGQAAVKLSVNHDGWYRVTRAELVTAGLDANADSTRLQLYLNGEELPIKVGADGTVEFYGRRLDAPATDKNVYWLIEGTTPGQRIQTLPTLPAGGQFASGFPMTVERQDKMIYFASLQNSDASNIFGPVVNSQSATQALQLRHLDGAANSPAQLEVAMQGVTSQGHLVSVTLNGQQVGVVSFTGREHKVWQVPVPMNALAEGENVVTLSRMNGDGDTSLVDYVRVTYARTYQAEANQLACTVAAGSTVKLGGFTTDDIRVIDVSDAAQPRELSVTAEPDGLGFAVSFDVAAAAQLLAFTGSSPMQQPAAMVANEPSAWNGLRHGANMVIITHHDFRQAVEPLAAHRRQQGLSVVVIDVEDIYDEFSYSTHGPQAIKDFLEWTRQHWPASPQYVLLVGDSSWDARNDLSLSQSEYVPTKLVDTTYMETASDDWLADFNNDGIAEMGVGRLPVKTAGQAATIVQKIIAYDQLRFDPRRGAMLVADNGFEAMSADIHSVIPDRMPVQIINRSSASDQIIRQRILDGINAGPRIVNYYGHGSIQVWTGAGLLQNSDANNLTNGSKLAVFTLMNCLNGYAHDAYIDSLGEALLKAENGGAVAVWASSGYTEPSGQAQVNHQLYQQVFTDSAVRLGDAIRSAKGATTNPDVRRTWVLLGDPSMRVK